MPRADGCRHRPARDGLEEERRRAPDLVDAAADPGLVDSWRDVDHLLSALAGAARAEVERVGFAAGWRALAGPSADPPDAPAALDPEQRLLRAEEAEILAFALRALQPRRRRVLTHLFGLLGHRARPMAEIAEAEGVSSNRIHQIVARGLRELRWMTAVRESVERRSQFPDETVERLLRIAGRRSLRFERGAPPPPLHSPWKPRRRRVLDGPSESGAARWWALPRAIAIGGLDSLLLRLATRLGLGRFEIVQVAPFRDPGQSGHTGARCVCWETPYAWQRHDGGEETRCALDAEVAFPNACALWLTGAASEFVAWSARGASHGSTARLEAAWVAVCAEQDDAERASTEPREERASESCAPP